jgi:hypothetical protein
MHAPAAESVFNPYASPPAEEPIIRAELAKLEPQPGSLVIIFPGFILLLVGYLASNIFAIADLYQVGFGPGGEVIPSPFAGALGEGPAGAWLLYGLFATAAVAGCILVGSQNFNPLTAVLFMMCPLVALVFLAAMPLRIAQKHVIPVAAAYLMVGTCLAGAGLMRMISLYGEVGLDFQPILASLMLQIGLAMLGGAMLKLARTPAL